MRGIGLARKLGLIQKSQIAILRKACSRCLRSPVIAVHLCDILPNPAFALVRQGQNAREVAMDVDRQRLLALDLDRRQLDPVDQGAQDIGGLGAVVGLVQGIA